MTGVRRRRRASDCLTSDLSHLAPDLDICHPTSDVLIRTAAQHPRGHGAGVQRVLDRRGAVEDDGGVRAARAAVQVGTAQKCVDKVPVRTRIARGG